MDDKDKAFAREVGPWGFAATAIAMIGIFFSGLASGIDILQSVGYTFFALLLVPLSWMFAGRYASYWLMRVSRKQIVRSVFIVFWVLLTAKLFFLSGPQSVSVGGILLAASCALFSGYAAARAFKRVESGKIEVLSDTSMPPWLAHSMVIVALAMFFLV